VEEDLMPLWEIAYSHPNPIWKRYDAPYFDDYQYFPNFEEFKLQKSEYFLNNSNRLGIFVDCKLVGTVSRYWECQKTRWMELGIDIYESEYWNAGIGRDAMLQWIDRTFQDYLELEHLGLTTFLSNFSYNKIIEIISKNDYTTLRQVPKLGEKKAQIIILDLKGKLKNLTYTEEETVSMDMLEDLVLALEGLGYNKKEIDKTTEKKFLESIGGIILKTQEKFEGFLISYYLDILFHYMFKVNKTDDYLNFFEKDSCFFDIISLVVDEKIGKITMLFLQYLLFFVKY